MRHIIAVTVILGTAATARAEGPFPPGWPGLSARTKAGARVSVRPDGPWLPKTAPARRSLEVHDDSGPNPRFEEEIWDGKGGVALALYVDRGGLETVTLADAIITPAAGGPAGPRDPHFRPLTGSVITEELGRRDGMVEVRYRLDWSGGGFEVRGFLPEHRIGTVFRHAMMGGDDAPDDITLPGKVDILAAPGGARFATFRERGRVYGRKLATKGKFTLVRTDRRIVGWVRSAQVKRLPPPSADGGEEGGVEGGVMGGVAGGAEPIRAGVLLRDTPLYDAPGGTIVGVVRSASYRATPVETKGGWVRHDIATPFGPVTVWAKPATAAEVAAANDAAAKAADLEAAAPPPPPPPRAVPAIVAPTQLEAQRTSGTRDIDADPATQKAMAIDGKTKIVASYKLCIDKTGVPTQVMQMKSSGYPAYDAQIERGMRTWRYRPWVVDGKVREACTAATFIYPRSR